MKSRKNIRRTGWIMVAAFMGLFLVTASVLADVNYDFVKQDGDAESKVGNIVKNVVTTIIGVGLGFSIIGIAWGAAQFFGRIFKMDKDEGMEKVKAGCIGIVVFGIFWAIMATIFNWVGM